MRRRRAGLIVGAAIGASVLAAAPAQAATLTVTSTLDAGDGTCAPDAECTLRDAVANANDRDTIVFASQVTGSIALTQGEISVDDDITIRGPGAGVLSVLGTDDGNGTLDTNDSRIFAFTSAADAKVSGLTLSGGGSSGTNEGDGGAVFVGRDAHLRLVDSRVTGNVAADDGGAIHAYGGDIDLVGSTVSGNRAASGGGVSGQPFDQFKYARVPNISLTDTTVSGNTATDDGGGVLSTGGLRVRRSTVSDNTSQAGRGGGIAQLAIRSLDVSDSVVADNRAPEGAGGGIALGGNQSKYSSPDTGELRNTTVAGNQAANGAGLAIGSVGGLSLTVVDSTVSGNQATNAGGGVLVQPDGGRIARGRGGSSADLDGRLDVVQSTVSGNTARVGAGVSVGSEERGAAAFKGIGITNSTVAANRASVRGGGLYLSAYAVYTGSEYARGGPAETTSATVTSRSTIFGDNTAADAPQDLDRADGSQGGGLDADFTLVEAAGDVPILQPEGAANLLGVDPQLAGLADNGGPTATHLPALTSPAVDRGDAPDRLTDDQRNRDRTVDLPADNAPRGDGTDIGAVEVERPAAPAPTPTPQAAAPPTIIVQQQPEVFTRIRALRLTARVTPGRDTSGPRTFRTTGRLILPPGITNQDGCASFGLVAVRVAVGNRTISTRRVQLQPDCTYRSAVTFTDPRRFGRRSKLLFTPRFLGNQRVFPISTRPGQRVTVRE